MHGQTMEILAVWKDRPSWFTSGTMQWVAQSTGETDTQRVRESPAFPLDGHFITDDANDSFIRIDRSNMDDAQRQVVESMLADFVASLKRDGWTQSGQGSDWFNLRFTRMVSS